jgi:hypothetical protein
VIPLVGVGVAAAGCGVVAIYLPREGNASGGIIFTLFAEARAVGLGARAATVTEVWRA